MDKLRKALVIALVAVAAAAFTVYFGRQANAQPGDISDPLVSKSYVDGEINKLAANILSGGVASSVLGNSVLSQNDRDAIIAEVLAYIVFMKDDLMDEILSVVQGPDGPIDEPGPDGLKRSYLFVVEELQPGQKIIGRQGTEFILRGGTATVISGVNGLADITQGIELLNGASVKINHLMFTPMDDGRGLNITTKAWVMVKGEYYIVD
ncbi:MAG: hypothetical protein FWE82_00345 [Defluviitaleaceae bacterium]|nr:hypothetical protein [Defluviitaleaceae bacterium]